MLTSTHLATTLDAIDWNRPRACVKASEETLGALARERALLTELVRSLVDDPDRLSRCETNPPVDRLVLAEDTTAADRFAAHVLHGGYVHTWNRRTSRTQTGPVTSDDLAAGTVTVEGPGSSYLYSHSLVHQTAVLPGSISLFLHGPVRQSQWHLASDLYDDGHRHQVRDDTRYRCSAPMSHAQLKTRVAELARLGVITTERQPRP
ncbi:hypothetical protein ACFYXM_10460 [Streptomyces sp. NPDC002476]|uniref:hypothetical protein n=1 Tax=Streptomyces sp. NPDC002476 TaxID=3364648 RepID=UPI0036A950C3